MPSKNPAVTSAPSKVRMRPSRSKPTNHSRMLSSFSMAANGSTYRRTKATGCRASVPITADGMYHIVTVEKAENIRLSDDYFIEAQKEERLRR